MRRHSMECLPQWSSNSLLLFVAVVVAAADVVVVAVAVVVAFVVAAVRGERFPKPIYTNSRSTAPGGHYFNNNFINVVKVFKVVKTVVR